MSEIKNYRDLNVWQKGKEIVVRIYKITREFPADERLGITSQMRRAATSIPSNIAEGFKRGYNKDFKRFLYMSLGSCVELETQIIISNEVGYLGGKNREELLEGLDHLGRMITSLAKKL